VSAPAAALEPQVRTVGARTLPAPDDLVEERRPVLARMAEAGRTPGGRLVVVGDPGAGKSFLVDALVRLLVPERTVLFVRGHGLCGSPYAALAALVADVASDAADEVRLAVERARALPGVATDEALERAVAETFAELVERGTTLVVDEWQWLDEPSIRVLQGVLSTEPLRDLVPVVLAGRRPSTDVNGGFFSPPQILRLEPLGPAAVTAVLAGSGLVGLSPASVASVVADSGGNPLWALALATARVTGDPRASASGTGADPEHRRLDLLPPTLRAVLAAVALMAGARLDELVRVVPGAETVVRDGLERGVLRTDDDVLTAADPRLGRAAVLELEPDAERALHRAVAALPLPRTQRVEHLDRSVAPGVDEGLAAELLLAARRARRTESPAVALRLLRRALLRTEQGSDRYAERAVEAAEVALAGGDAALVPVLLRPLDASLLTLPVFDRAATVLAESATRTDGPGAVVRFFTGVQRVLVPGSTVRAVAEVHRRLAAPGTDVERLVATLPPALADGAAPHTLARLLAAQARSRLDARAGVDDALLARVRELDAGTGPLETSADALAAGWAYQVDDLARSRAGLAAQVRAATAVGEPYAAVDALAHSAALEVLAGRLDAADALLREVAEQAALLSSLPDAVLRARALRAIARDDVAARDALLTGPVDPVALDLIALLRAAVTGLEAAASGSWEVAATALRRLRATAEERGIAEPGRRLWLDVELVRALVELGRLSEADEVVDAVVEVGRRPGRVHARGQGRRLQALLAQRSGDLAGALVLSERGLGDLQVGGFRPQLVRAQLERVAMLVQDGRRAQARQLLDTATASAGAIGDPRLLADARRLAPTLTAGPRTGGEALTPSELRVARAVAAGQANRAIAADLVVSVRTVETHLANAYRKLGVHTRTQLALRLDDRPLAGRATRSA